MEGLFTYAFQGNNEGKTSPGRFMESTRSSSKETIGNWRGGGRRLRTKLVSSPLQSLLHTVLPVLKFLWKNKTFFFHSYLESTADSFL